MSSCHPSAPNVITLVTAPSAEFGVVEFSLSEVGPLEEGGDNWGFNLYGNNKTYIAQFVYADEIHARLGAAALTASLTGAVYVGSDEG
jgi:hypothetical protein